MGCKVHLGFMADYLSLKGQVEERVKSLSTAYKTTSLIVGGHSLGAAISTLSAL